MPIPRNHLGTFRGQNSRRFPSLDAKRRAHLAAVGLIAAILLMGLAFASVVGGLARADAVYAAAERV